jgi:ABC-2 type transport system ATP-binding protein
LSIQVTNLTKTYGQQKAVDGISFSVGKPEIVGFLGPNGAGKSTTMKMITGYLQADEGTITVCGQLVTPHQTETKKRIGYLPESNPLYSDMYIREYLGFIANIHGIKNKEQAIDQVIQQVRLQQESTKKIHQLSKGYKQRVGLAAALIPNPEVLILDEPTSGLDPNQLIEIREVIRNLAQHKTILFSSHILQEVEALCERVIIINQGKLVANDNLSNLKKARNSSTTIKVKFQEAINITEIQSLFGIENIRTNMPGSFEWETENPEKIQKQLLEWSFSQSLHIESWQTVAQDLEDVFKSLTINKPKE